jgi:hypothetical protein
MKSAIKRAASALLAVCLAMIAVVPATAFAQDVQPAEEAAASIDVTVTLTRLSEGELGVSVTCGDISRLTSGGKFGYIYFDGDPGTSSSSQALDGQSAYAIYSGIFAEFTGENTSESFTATLTLYGLERWIWIGLYSNDDSQFVWKDSYEIPAWNQSDTGPVVTTPDRSESVYVIGSAVDYVFRIDKDFSLFDTVAGVTLDDNLLASENYTVTEGSTVVTIKSAYLDTLSVGTHTVKVSFIDGTTVEHNVKVDVAGSTVTTTAPAVPATGDTTVAMVTIASIIALLGATLLAVALHRIVRTRTCAGAHSHTCAHSRRH